MARIIKKVNCPKHKNVNFYDFDGFWICEDCLDEFIDSLKIAIQHKALNSTLRDKIMEIVRRQIQINAGGEIIG